MRKKYFPHAFGPTFDDMRDFARELERRCAELEKALKPFVDAYCLREELYRKSKYALEWVINLPDEWVIGLAVSMGSCRTARAAVEKGKGNL